MTPSILTLIRELEAAARAEGDAADAALERNPMDSKALTALCVACGITRATTYIRTYAGLVAPTTPALETAGTAPSEAGVVSSLTTTTESRT